MKHSNASDNLDQPRDAAHWFARMQSGEATEEDRRAFEAWRAADPENDRQYRNLDHFWEATRAVPERRLRGMMEEAPQPVPQPRLSRRQFGLGLAAACSLVAVTYVVGTSGVFNQPLESIELATTKGERRQIALPDGSTLDLNTNTLAVVRFYQDQRRIDLQQGEIFIAVRPDADRPFVVDAGMGQATVTGTRFNVRRDADAVGISVESGSVRVRSGPWWNRRERALTAGQRVVAHADQPLGDVSDADVSAIAAWQRGRVIFNNEPLAHVINEMNRYLARPAQLEAAHLGQYHISGVFSVDDPEAMIDALPAIAPVRVVHLPDGQARILAR
ncbi:FecR family protein [Pseudomonas sp. FME51]|uniref:FecR family protein n=1 Tax=Pseudomonas sp. FME51 TaxID=2742609 RepID=UPI0018685AB4|nr:FecR family protein [Pseudomonas sp. FME51]